MSTTIQTQRPLAVTGGAAEFANLLACGEFYAPTPRPIRQALPQPETTLPELFSQVRTKRSLKTTRHESTYSTSA